MDNKVLVHDVSNELAIVLGVLNLIEKSVKEGRAEDIVKLLKTAKNKVINASDMLRENLIDTKVDAKLIIPAVASEIGKNLNLEIVLNVSETNKMKLGKIGTMRTVTNILKNASESGAKKVSITISSNRLVFSDDGRGMTPELVEKLNNQNFTTTKISGTGVGCLSIYKFAKKNKLTVKFSSLTKGVSISFTNNT